MSLLHSKRPPPPMEVRDFDHEIMLVDHTLNVTPTLQRSSSPVRRRFDSPAQRREGCSKSCLLKHETPFHLRQKLRCRKFARYRDQNPNAEPSLPADNPQPKDQVSVNEVRRPERVQSRDKKKEMSRLVTTPNSSSNVAVDVLFENQRGGFLFGRPFFSARALGNLDPAPWTNIAQKPSATNIQTAQPPDPSWEWAWKEWCIHNTEITDKDGWQYSFAFHGNFTWHKGRWWNSFVRRRAWLRKRIKKKVERMSNEDYMLNSDHFTVHSHPLHGKSQSSSLERSTRYANGEINKDNIHDEICDIGTLRNVLRSGRIDREKIDAVKNFIENGKEELIYLKDQMHDIMRLLMFQASRHALAAHLRKVLEEKFSESRYEKLSDDEQQQFQHLAAALEAAEREIVIIGS